MELPGSFGTLKSSEGGLTPLMTDHGGTGMTVKEQVLEVITRMPDDSTLDDIGYELYVIESVQKGLDELDRGEYLTHEQAKEKLQKWVK